MLIIPAIVESMMTRKDGTWKCVLGTNELTPDQVLGLSGYLNEFCFVAMQKDDFKNKEKEMIGNLKSDFEDNSKTPAQRIRSVLYVLFNQDQEGFDTFDAYYRNKTEKYIDHLKAKIV